MVTTLNRQGGLEIAHADKQQSRPAPSLARCHDWMRVESSVLGRDWVESSVLGRDIHPRLKHKYIITFIILKEKLEGTGLLTNYYYEQC